MSPDAHILKAEQGKGMVRMKYERTENYSKCSLETNIKHVQRNVFEQFYSVVICNETEDQEV